MRVRMLSLSAGPNGARHAGSEHDVEDEEGRALVAGGYAERVDEPAPPLPAIETAAAAPAEEVAAAVVAPPQPRRNNRR